MDRIGTDKVECGEIVQTINACVMRITPELAVKWLARNVANNRNLKKTSIATYADDMANGHWGLTPDAIAFDRESRMFNGQNRLNAIVKSGKAVDAFVVFDFPITPEDMMKVDGGVKRSYRDAMKIGEIEDRDMLCGGDIASAYLRIKYGISGTVSPDMKMDFIKANREIVRWTYKMCRHNNGGGNKGRVKTRLPSTYAVALMDAKMCGENEDALQKFVAVYCDNDFEGIENYSPRYAIELRDGKFRPQHIDTFNYAKCSINAFAKKLTKMYVRENVYKAPLLKKRIWGE